MKNLIIINLVLLTLLGCSQTIALKEHQKTNYNHQKYLAYLQMVDVHSDITLLELLRNNKIDDAIGLLEGELDTDIVMLNRSIKKEQSEKSRTDYLEALRQARNYRGKYPRELTREVSRNPNRSADFFKGIVEASKGERDFKEVIQKNNDETAVAAEKILSEIE